MVNEKKTPESGQAGGRDVNRRTFLSFLASMPFVGKLFAREKEMDLPLLAEVRTPVSDDPWLLDMVWFDEEPTDHIWEDDLCPLCEKPISEDFNRLNWGYKPNSFPPEMEEEWCSHAVVRPYWVQTTPPSLGRRAARSYRAQLLRRREMESTLMLSNDPTPIPMHKTAASKVWHIDAMLRRVEEAMK